MAAYDHKLLMYVQTINDTICTRLKVAIWPCMSVATLVQYYTRFITSQHKMVYHIVVITLYASLQLIINYTILAVKAGFSAMAHR